MWKSIESNYAQGQYETAAKWCSLAMHPIFEKSGELNMGRISRSVMKTADRLTMLISGQETSTLCTC